MKNSNGKRDREVLIRVLDSGLIQSHSKPIIIEIWEAYFFRRRVASSQ